MKTNQIAGAAVGLGRDWSDSINKPGAHTFYARSKINAIAEQILFSQSATENERLLADCIIALNGGVRQ